MPNNILVTQIYKDAPINATNSDIVELEWYEASRKIMRKTSKAGHEVAFRLFSEGSALSHKDVVYMDSESTLHIVINPCEVIVLRPSTLAEMARVCYEIGNKHAPLCMDGDDLLMPTDEPMFRWLSAAGYAPVKEMRRLSKMLRSNSHVHADHPRTKKTSWKERPTPRNHGQ